MTETHDLDGPLPVLLVDPGGGRGGGERVVEEVAKSCSGTRFHPIVVSLAIGSWADALSEAGIETYVIPRHRYGWGREIRVIVRLLRIGWASRAVLVHASLNSSLLYASVVAKLRGLPLIWHLHDPLPMPAGSGRALVSILRRLRPDFVIFGNDSCVESWRSTFPGDSVPPHRTIWPGVSPLDMSCAEPARARKRLGLRPDSPLIGMFARYAGNKGHEDLVRAAQVVHERVPSAQIVICTAVDLPSGPLERLMELRSVCGLSECVVFAGGVSEETRIDLLAALSVLAHPATSEPFGLAMLEAMSAGRPVVAAASHGARFLLQDGKVGVIVPPAQPEAFGQALADLLEDSDRRQVLGAAARERSLLLTSDRMAQQVLSVWTSVLGGQE